MPILIPTPIVVPEKQFDKYLAWQIVITTPTPQDEATAVVSLLPFNDAGETFKEGNVTMRVNNIKAKAAANPTGNMAKAMYYLLQAIDEEKQLQDAQNNPQDGN